MRKMLFFRKCWRRWREGMQATPLSSLAALLQNASLGAPKPAEQDVSAVDKDLETALAFVNSL